MMFHSDSKEHYIQHGAFFRGKCFKRFRYLFWHVVCWSLWLFRNKIIFNGGSFNMCVILDLIKLRSRSWFVAFKGRGSCSFSKWCSNPVECIKR